PPTSQATRTAGASLTSVVIGSLSSIRPTKTDKSALDPPHAWSELSCLEGPQPRIQAQSKCRHFSIPVSMSMLLVASLLASKVHAQATDGVGCRFFMAKNK